MRMRVIQPLKITCMLLLFGSWVFVKSQFAATTEAGEPTTVHVTRLTTTEPALSAENTPTTGQTTTKTTHTFTNTVDITDTKNTAPTSFASRSARSSDPGVSTRTSVWITTLTTAAATLSSQPASTRDTKASAVQNQTIHVTIAGIVTGGVVFSILIVAIATVCIYRIRTSRDNSSTIERTKTSSDDTRETVEMNKAIRQEIHVDTNVAGDKYEEAGQNRQSTAFYEQLQPSHQEETIAYSNLAGGDQRESTNVYENPLRSTQQEGANVYDAVANEDHTGTSESVNIV